MKFFSNTVIAALIALGLTAIVGVLPYTFFEGLESHAGDGMMWLCYKLHKKYAPLPPDPHIVLAAIDDASVQELGRWPFPRSVHGQFLQVLAPEKPKTVGWDIFFTEPTQTNPTDATAPDSSAPAAPANATPPDATGNTPPPPSAPDSSTAAPPPASTPAPPIKASSPDAADNSPPPSSPAPASAAPADSATKETPPPAINPEDQALADGAALFPDMVFASYRDSGIPTLKSEDLLPTRSLKNVHGDVSKLLSSSSAALPIPVLRKNSYFGFADDDTKGGVRRTMPLVVNINGMILPSIDLQILLQYWGVDPDQVTVDLGREITVQRPDGTQEHIPVDEHGFLTINYRAVTGDFMNESYVWMAKGLADKLNNVSSKDRDNLIAIKDRIVIAGVTLVGTDAGVTPLDTYAPLVGTHLNVLNNVLQHDYLRPLTPWVWLPIYGLFLFVAGNLMLRVGIAPMIPIGFFALLIVALVAFAGLWFGNLQIPVVGPEFGLLVLASAIPTKRFFGEEREKMRIKTVLRANLSEKVMTKMLAHPDNLKLGGVKQEITIMFCDIRGFTAYCDNRDSQEVMDVLNQYMEEMTQVVFKYDGTVDKYIGDCIMAFWNAPDLQPDHAQRAVCCAMEMRYALANFKTKRAGLDTELFECGIGIHTGEALVGNMGSSLKRNYTAMGSTVNLGARLEALTKRLNERILISADTFKQLQGDFPITDRGEAMVPGFANPIRVYAIGADQDISSALKIGRKIATQQEYTAEEVSKPIWEPAPLPADADPNP